MFKPNAFNPLQWDCDKQGCFNKKHRLKFGVFYEALPNRVSFSDVDGITEYCGNALLIEWKSAVGPLPLGQRIMYQRITKGTNISVICVAGDAETMKATHTATFFNGVWQDWKATTTAELNLRIKNWVKWSQQHSRLGNAA